MAVNEGVLTETGTNELEIVEFTIGENRFGINVIKVKEILVPTEVTKVPHSHPSVEGIIDIRGEVVTVVNLTNALGFADSEDQKQDKFILAEFNKAKIVFHVHNVTQIHRISWEQIEKPGRMYQGLETQLTGIIKREEDMLLLLDFEKIVADISPESTIHKEQISVLGERERSSKRIMIAEDSGLLRAMLQETLKEAGYYHTIVFEDGEEAYHHLQSLADDGKNPHEEYQLIITDIEMPRMDGHRFTKLIKEDENLQGLPVVIFSSLITDDLRHKGEKVGANAQVSKPEIVDLINVIDRNIL
ncbi:chemotaxis protein [Salimicrobium flavidum]|nr:chemotaxis protein [Salimicrobium flavidum]